jgi:hypothetical protein
MSLKRFVLGVEFYKAGNEEEPAFVNGGLTHLIDGSKITVLEVPEEIEATREFLLDFARATIEMLKNMPPEVIKAKLPKFYLISTTKQFWLHVFQESFIALNQIKEEPVFEDPSLEANTEFDSENIPLLEMVDVFLDFDGNELNGPPDRINFWDSL